MAKEKNREGRDMSFYRDNDFLKGDMVIRRSGLDTLISIMQASGYAVTTVPISTDPEYVRIVITNAKSGYYK